MLEVISLGLDRVYYVEVIIIRIAIILCDMIGVAVLMATVFRSIVNYIHKDRHVKLMLAQGIALALEFKLAGEVLRTVTVRDWNELVILGTIIALRAAITLLIHFEIKAEKSEQKSSGEKIEIEEENKLPLD
ncbi:MAG: DUF1622 domain-containing protein [Defluviitaleaceae bacterium]|nr:DUF1622 domain-containing protein [Defluviitaleaceae bacterium]